MEDNNQICKKHSGHEAKIAELEKNVKSLWDKWDSMQRWAFCSLGALILNLVGVIALLIKS